jgi:hypothetical protein
MASVFRRTPTKPLPKNAEVVREVATGWLREPFAMDGIFQN